MRKHQELWRKKPAAQPCPGPSTCMSWQPCLYMETHKQTNKTPKTKPKSINQSAHLRLTGGSTGRLSWGTAAWKLQGCLGVAGRSLPTMVCSTSHVSHIGWEDHMATSLVW